jgi:hypothetical protein
VTGQHVKSCVNTTYRWYRRGGCLVGPSKPEFHLAIAINYPSPPCTGSSSACLILTFSSLKVDRQLFKMAFIRVLTQDTSFKIRSIAICAQSNIHFCAHITCPSWLDLQSAAYFISCNTTFAPTWQYQFWQVIWHSRSQNVCHMMCWWNVANAYYRCLDTLATAPTVHPYMYNITKVYSDDVLRRYIYIVLHQEIVLSSWASHSLRSDSFCTTSSWRQSPI